MRSAHVLVHRQVYYHLEELDDALKFALGAGNFFDVSVPSEYVETLICECFLLPWLPRCAHWCHHSQVHRRLHPASRPSL